jgi:hypothetical protein
MLRSTRTTFILSVVIAAMRTGTACAELVVFEPFDYPAGTVLDGTAGAGAVIAHRLRRRSATPGPHKAVT